MTRIHLLTSSPADLQKRGFASADVISSLENLPASQLITLLHAEEAVIRTAAAHNLFPLDDWVTTHLLEQLSVEKCLYTKIAIGQALEKGSLHTARKMTPYLGKIGGNQHRTLPERISAKQSFPLPRDIIARSLGKMDSSIFPALLDVLYGKEEMKINEVLDAIGFMSFYHPEIATEGNAQAIYKVMGDFRDNVLIVWKSIICLSAFPQQQSVMILHGFASHNNLLGEEAKRSLRLISARKT